MAARVGKYLLFEVIGEGAFGKVKLGVHEDTGDHVAVKIMDKTHIKRHEMSFNVRREIAIMKALSHKNIVNMRQVLSSASKLYIVMDLVSGGELFTKILNEGAVEEKMARHYFQQLVDGVDYCHRSGVCHRDLKPENLLIDERTGDLKITDFGLSALLRPSEHDKEGENSELARDDQLLLHTQCGSVNYVAPEVLTASNAGYQGPKVDSWASGIILYALLAGYLPFFSEDTKALYRMIQKEPVRYPNDFPEGAKDLVNKLLDKNPETRYTMDDCRTHPWFAVGYETDESIDKESSPVVWNPAAFGKKQRESSGSNPEPDALPAADQPQGHVGSTESPPSIIPERTQQPGARSESIDAEAPRIDASYQQRVERAVRKYEFLFQVHASGSLRQSQSFRDIDLGFHSQSQNVSSSSSLLGRAKAITAAWYVTLSQLREFGLKVDVQTVTENELSAFEGLIAFWTARAESVGRNRRDRWWLDASPVSNEDIVKLMDWTQTLEPRPDDENVEDVMTTDTGAFRKAENSSERNSSQPTLAVHSRRGSAASRSTDTKESLSTSSTEPIQPAGKPSQRQSLPSTRKTKTLPSAEHAGEDARPESFVFVPNPRAISDVTSGRSDRHRSGKASPGRRFRATSAAVSGIGSPVFGRRVESGAGASGSLASPKPGPFVLSGRAVSDVSGRPASARSGGLYSSRDRRKSPSNSGGQDGSNRNSSSGKLLGAQAFTAFLKRRASASFQFQSQLSPARCLHELGKIMTRDGCLVMTKRGGGTKMKVEVPSDSGTAPLLLSFTAKREGSATTIAMKRAKGDRSNVRAAQVQFVLQSTYRKFLATTTAS